MVTLLTFLFYWHGYFIDAVNLLTLLLYWHAYFIDMLTLLTCLLYWHAYFIHTVTLLTHLLYLHAYFIDSEAILFPVRLSRPTRTANGNLTRKRMMRKIPLRRSRMYPKRKFSVFRSSGWLPLRISSSLTIWFRSPITLLWKTLSMWSANCTNYLRMFVDFHYFWIHV